MAVPRFNHELPKLRRQGSFSWSLIIHAIFITLMLTAARWLPQGHIERRQLIATTLYAPPIETAPVPKVIPPAPQVLAKLSPPRITPPPEPPKIEAPKIEAAPKTFDIAKPVPALPKLEPKKEIVTGAFATNAPAAPVRPKEKDVVTDSFASGSSAQATLQKAPRDVQTGGFGDPNGVKGNSERKGLVQVASLGSFGAPAGPGEGNGSGGSRGARGTVASTGFGDGMAGSGQGDHHRGGGGTVAQAGFGGAPAAASAPRARVEDKPAVTPVEITYKPQPVYTAEARQLRLEGEVLVQVMFAASGDLRIQQVVRGLGHGLDEAALQAARQIRFHPARRNGEPYDSVALVHIVFELAR